MHRGWTMPSNLDERCSVRYPVASISGLSMLKMQGQGLESARNVQENAHIVSTTA